MDKIKHIIDPQGNSFSYKKITHEYYKYKSIGTYQVCLKFYPLATINTTFYNFKDNGILTIKPGYIWDGASGPTIDTKSTMRASCIHDVLYQMMRLNQLSLERKDPADKELQRIMIEDSSNSLWNKIRSSYYYYGVKWFGSSSCEPK